MLRSRQDKHLHGVPPHETVLYNELVALFKSEAIQGVLDAKTGGMFAEQMNRLKGSITADDRLENAHQWSIPFVDNPSDNAPKTDLSKFPKHLRARGVTSDTSPEIEVGTAAQCVF